MSAFNVYCTASPTEISYPCAKVNEISVGVAPPRKPDKRTSDARTGCLSLVSIGRIYWDPTKHGICAFIDMPICPGDGRCAVVQRGFPTSAKDNQHSVRFTIQQVDTSTRRIQAGGNYCDVKRFPHPCIPFEGLGLVKRLSRRILVLVDE